MRFDAVLNRFNARIIIENHGKPLKPLKNRRIGSENVIICRHSAPALEVSNRVVSSIYS